MRTPICDRFGIEFPIFAFSHCRDVVAAVTNAGGMGVLGAGGFSPEQLDVELRWIDEHVGGRPYGVDVLMPASYVGAGQPIDTMLATLDAMIPGEHRRFVDEILERHGVPPLQQDEAPPSVFIGMTHEGARAQLDVAFRHPIALLVNALGPLPADVVDAARAHGIKVGALVGSTHHALKQAAAGVDVIIAQGTEAGGHTGEITTMVLVPDVVDAVDPLPVLAAGGIGTGRQMAAALALGAQGVWTGSVWLTVSESDTPSVVVDKLLAAAPQDTVRSRSLSGKPIRMLRTAWTDAWAAPDAPQTLRAPLQAILFEEADRRIRRGDSKELAGSPVGQIVGRMRSVRSARDVLFEMIEEYLSVVEHLAGARAKEDQR